jgi:UDP-N-acetylglucosamine--N-acetylmuramyl-(pentapeptide) pyrophosphoryl-undecaprenol N-acetylglucosamine transferase
MAQMGTVAPLILLAAGGTGGHLFPAEALGTALMARGYRVRLVTDTRAARYSGLFTAEMIDVVPSETLRSRGPLALLRTFATLAAGMLRALALVRRSRPVAVVGFGGYPTLPPLVAAMLLRVPTIVHDANAVLGRANRLLGRGATAIAVSFPGILDGKPAFARKARLTGYPVRSAIRTAAAEPFSPPAAAGPFRLLIFGGSQGARVMADVVPAATALLDASLRARLDLVQQVREEDMARVRAAYDRAGIKAELAPFISDIAARYAAAHLVVARSGAGTVAELSAIGRPSILVPLPGAIDQDQFANAGVLDRAGGAIRVAQTDFSPEWLAGKIAELAALPDLLGRMAAAARGQGSLDADARLADLVEAVARGNWRAEKAH